MLENRTLFASVGTNQIGVFDGANGPVRINVYGKGKFDFVGATRDENGLPRLNDIPMTIFDQGGNVVRQILGGFGGLDGIDPIATVVDTSTTNSAAGADAIAADNRGRTYGINRSGGGNVSLIRYDFNDNGTPNIEDTTLATKMLPLAQAELGVPGLAQGNLARIIGADFDPSTATGVNQNLLYFAAEYNVPFSNGNSNTPVLVPVMFTYNTSTGAVNLIPGEFGFGDPTNDKISISDFTFIDNDQIAFFGSVQQGTNPAQVGLFTTDDTFIDATNFQPLIVGPVVNGVVPAPITSLASLEYIPGSNFLVAVSAPDSTKGATATDNNARLLRFDLDAQDNAQIGFDLGPVDDPANDPTFAGRGDNIFDLAWNPRLQDQDFQPGKRGVLIGVDVGINQLVGIDSRERFQTPDLYSVYGSNTTTSTSLAISPFTLNPNTNLPFNTRLFTGQDHPYSGTAGTIRTNMLPANANSITLGNGGLYIGIRTPDENNAIVIPVQTLPKSGLEGASPGVTLPNEVRPGVYVSGSMRDLFVGGTITGSVRVSGSVDTFYAGNVETGDLLNGATNQNDNFYVGGDLRNLVVTGGIGAPSDATDIRFIPGTDFNVKGRIQAIKTGATWRGALDVGGATSEQTIDSQVDELENVPVAGSINPEGLLFSGDLTPLDFDKIYSTGKIGLLDGVVRNDTFGTAQILGSFRSRSRGVGQQVSVDGNVDNSANVNDDADFYGVPLMAGQTMTVQLNALQEATVSVLDPDGHVVATDQSNQNKTAFLNSAFQIKANQPGVYRIEIRVISTLTASVPYTMTVDTIGDMAIGGLVSAGDAFFSSLDMAAHVRTADLGAILAGGQIFTEGGFLESGNRSAFPLAIQADKGNIRTIQGESIGESNDALTQFGGFPDIVATKGSIGLIRADGTGGFGFAYFNFGGINSLTGRPAAGITTGGNYQVIQAVGDVEATIAANGSIGVIRAASWANRGLTNSTTTIQGLNTTPGYISINADGNGKAELGLIDIAGDFGNFTQGGPALSSGNGGNIRYLRVGGAVYGDRFFTGGSVNIFSADNAAVTVNDDSGTTVRITPVVTAIQTSTTPTTNGDLLTGGGVDGTTVDPFGGGFIPDPFNGAGSTGGTVTTTVNFNDPFGSTVPTADIFGNVEVASYGVRTGGSVIFNVFSTTGVNIATVGKRNGGGGAVADITTLRTGSVGAAVVQSGTGVIGAGIPSQETPLSLATGSTLDVILSGTGTINVFEVGASDGAEVGTGTGLTQTVLDNPGIINTATYTRIINNTNGEIVNVSAASVGRLEAARLGVASPVGGVTLEGFSSSSINDARFAGGLAGLFPFVDARNAIRVGNAIDVISRGVIGNVAASGDIQNLIANADGKNDKSQFEGVAAPILAVGTIHRIDIGEGVADSGSGDVAQAGIYAGDSLGPITNANGGGDVRGDIIARAYIESIKLTGNASFINADVFQGPLVTALDAGNESFPFDFDLIGVSGSALTVGIGDVSTSGTGGIISSTFAGANFGQVTVAKTGFGIFTSTFNSEGTTTIGGITAGGLGIRGTRISGGGFIGKIAASGTGKVRRLSEFASGASPSLSKSGFDSHNGLLANTSTDLYLYLGATPKKNKIAGITDDGIIEDSILSANRSINSVSAYDIRSRISTGARVQDETFPMQINFADSIGKISAINDLNGVRMVGSAVGSITSGGDMTQTLLSATGKVKMITAGKNVSGTVKFNITGQGTLGTLQVNGFMNGSVFAAQGITTLVVKGDIGSAGSNDSTAGILSGGDITTVRIGGSLIRNAYVRAQGLIKTLVLDGDITKNARLRATSFGKVTINGTEFGQLITG